MIDSATAATGADENVRYTNDVQAKELGDRLGGERAVSPQMKQCMNDVAGALAYPKPGTSLSVGDKRVFDFKPCR